MWSAPLFVDRKDAGARAAYPELSPSEETDVVRLLGAARRETRALAAF